MAFDSPQVTGAVNIAMCDVNIGRHAMRYGNTRKILQLARALASSAEGLTLDDMCRETASGRRTVERMRDTIREVFPQMEEIPDPPTKRFRIPKGLDGFFQDPTAEEMSDLGIVIGQLRETGATARAASLTELEKKIRSAIRFRRRAMATDVEALLRAERMVVQAGPRPAEDPAMLVLIREALLRMKTMRFVYHGGSRPGDTRDVVPFGIIFGGTNYLIGADAGMTKPKHWRLDRIENPTVLDSAGIAAGGFRPGGVRQYAVRLFRGTAGGRGAARSAPRHAGLPQLPVPPEPDRRGAA